MIRLRADTDHVRLTLRRREIEAVFRDVPEDAFERALELGAGDGAQSRLISRYAMEVLCTDLNKERLVQESHPRITYDICDSVDLPYETGRFDLVYSSNLLEHLRDPARALSEMRRVMRDDGVMVHVVPNRFWKLLHIALFYPNLALSVVEAALSGGRAPSANGKRPLGSNMDREAPSFLRRNIWPSVHGEYAGHLAEFTRMGASYWRRMLEEAGLELSGMVQGLPAHSPYRFGMNGPRRVCESMGLSSCNGYVLTKAGSSSPKVSMLVGPGRVTAGP